MKSKLLRRASTAITVALFCAPALAATNIPLNAPTVVNGVEAVCTGIGDEAQRDPRWVAYPLKIVFAGKGGQYVTDADVVLSQNGNDVVSVHCEGPWVLVKVPAGRYRITGVLEGQTAQTNAIAPANGQGRAILRFLNSGGETSVEQKETQ